MPPIEDQRRASVTYARTSAFSDLDHQLIGYPVPTRGRCPQADPSPVVHMRNPLRRPLATVEWAAEMRLARGRFALPGPRPGLVK
jgi:hypothetical protein